jgi:hypothetical protein
LVLIERRWNGPAGSQKISPYAEEVDSPREVFFWMLTLECGIKVNEAWLEWIESVIQRIENKQHPSD